MNSLAPRARAKNAANLAILFGTASFAALVSATAYAQPAAQAAAPVEEVLVTGSLIRGAEAVGVPVTAVGTEDFQEAGAITISDMLKNVPSIDVVSNIDVVQTSGANRQRLQNAEIHGIGGQATTMLLMINGRRYPAQGTNLENVDPSIISQLPIDHIDIFAAGASATYGSDAVSGVLNIILKRGFDGATTMARVGMSTDLGWDSANFEGSQLYGRTWDTGDVTVSYDWWERRRIQGSGRDYLTTNFEPFGFDDRTFLASSYPGVVTTGAPSSTGLGYNVPTGGAALSPNTGTRYCTNCYSIPKGAGWDFGTQDPGPTTTWSALLANKGVTNERSPYEFGSMNPSQQSSQATITFDQSLIDDLFGTGSKVSLFVDGFYMNRRSQLYYLPGYSPCTGCKTPASGQPVPTTNPYYPAGAPAGLRINATLGAEIRPYQDAGSVSQQMAFGFNFDDLPFGWAGNAYYSMSQELSWAIIENQVNANMFNAAVGNTVGSAAASGSTPAHAAYTKPANLPYLNLFCDSIQHQCNSPATLAYIQAFRDDRSTFDVQEATLNLNGPIFDLPGGPIRGAVQLQKVSQHFIFINNTNEATQHTEQILLNLQVNNRKNWAALGELNIPIIGEANEIPLVKSFVIDVGYRYDHYYNADDYVGDVHTPKLTANWDVGWGLSFRGATGKAFNAAPFGLISNFTGVRETHELINVPGSRATATNLNCPAHNAAVPNPIVSGTVSPGSLQAYLNPLGLGCPGHAADPNAGTFASVANPVGIDLGGSAVFRNGGFLGPETSRQWSTGFDFAPDDTVLGGMLTGLVVDAEYWWLQREDIIGDINPGEGVNDPLSLNIAAGGVGQVGDPFQTQYVVIPRPDLALTAPENASFKAKVDLLVATGKALFDASALPFVKFIDIGSTGNQHGWEEYAGIDFSVRYDWDMGDLGAWNARMAGSYQTRQRSQDSPVSLISSTYTQTRRENGQPDGANSGHQMQRMRFTLGWADAGWNVTLGSTWRPHNMNGGSPPACFWRSDYGPGSTLGANGLCYPGAPYYPQPIYTAPAGTPQPDQRFGGILQPSQMFFDLAIGYNTMDEPANPYLKNLRFGFNVNNILNRLPSAIDYDSRTSSGSARIREGDTFQRTISFTVTKAW